MDFCNGFTVICNNKSDYISNKKLYTSKFKSPTDLKRDLLGEYQIEAYYQFCKENNCSYEIAKIFLNHTLLVDECSYNDEKLDRLVKYKKEYKKFLIKNPLAKNYYGNIIFPNYFTDNYVYKAIKNLKYVVNDEKNIPSSQVYEFSNCVKEVIYLANEIVKLLKNGVNHKNIKINKLEGYYIPVVKEVFKFYNIDFSDEEMPLFSYPKIKELYNELIKYSNYSIYEGFNLLMEGKTGIFAEKMLGILNKYVSIDSNVCDILPFIYDDLNNTNYKKNYNNAIKTYDLNDLVINDNDYLFILGFNADVLPKTHKDNNFLDNKILESLGLYTTLDMNNFEKKNLTNVLSKAYSISYSKASLNGDLMPSPFIAELGLKVEKKDDLPLSDKRLKFLLASFLDDYYVYGKIDDNLPKLANFLGYSQNNKLENKDYKSYSHKYNGSYKMPSPIHLSYTSIDCYYRCQFKYYLEKVLKISKPTDLSNLDIGNYFHYCLSVKEDLKTARRNYLKERELSRSEEYYYNRYDEIINRVREFNNFDSKFKIKGQEIEKFIKIHNNILTGKIDKLLTYNDSCVVIDYKTGNIDKDLNPLFYGLKMQLPMYLYYLKDEYKFGGIYYQKVLPSKPFKEGKNIDLEYNKYFELEGYSNSSTILDFDNTLSHVKGVTLKKDQSFDKRSFNYFLDDEQVKLVLDKCEEKVIEAFSSIANGNFSINPKRFKDKEQDESCGFCIYKDICFKKKSDEVILEDINWLGGDFNDDSNEE